MKVCAKCGHEIADEVKFCPKCGNQQENHQPPKKAVSSKRIAALIIGICILIAGGIILCFGGKKDNKGERETVLAEPKSEAEYSLPAESDETKVQEPEKEENELVLITQYVDLTTYTKPEIKAVTQSSVLGNNSDGSSNDAWMALDGKDSTCWQEGVAGSGIGETVEISLNRKQQISYLTFRLGNWQEDRYYYGNNRPKTLSISLGDVTRQVTFPDGRQEFVVAVTPAIQTDSIRIRVDDVYRGENWDDTVITDIGICAENDGLGWQKINEKWYYYEEEDKRKTGWLEQNGKKYYLLADGEMKTGFLNLKQLQKRADGTYSDGTGYFFLEDGSMYVGDVYTYFEGKSNKEEGQEYAQSLGGIYVPSESDNELDEENHTVWKNVGQQIAELTHRFYADGSYDTFVVLSE